MLQFVQLKIDYSADKTQMQFREHDNLRAEIFPGRMLDRHVSEMDFISSAAVCLFAKEANI